MSFPALADTEREARRGVPWGMSLCQYGLQPSSASGRSSRPEPVTSPWPRSLPDSASPLRQTRVAELPQVTVKLVALLALPLGVFTLILPVLAVVGTLAMI